MPSKKSIEQNKEEKIDINAFIAGDTALRPILVFILSYSYIYKGKNLKTSKNFLYIKLIILRQAFVGF